MNKNKTAIALSLTGKVFIILGILAAIAIAADRGRNAATAAISIGAGGVVSGLLFLFCSEVLNLLQKLVDNNNSSLDSNSPVDQIHHHSPTNNDAPLYYSSNGAKTVQIGNQGTYSYILTSDNETTSSYEKYCVINFDLRMVYLFCIEDEQSYFQQYSIIQGSLNDRVIAEYNSDGRTIALELHFAEKNVPLSIVLSDSKTTFEYIATDLKQALSTLRYAEKFLR